MPPRTEREVNSPSPLTLQLLGVIFLGTFLPWAAAKLACNIREAPLREPPELALDVLAKQPKEAALELQQRAAEGRFKEAAELARGDAAKELLDADARCQTDPKPCEALRAQAAHVSTRAVLVGRGANNAEARAESQVSGGQVERFVMQLQPDGGRWYVVSRKPYAEALTTPVPVIQLNPAALSSVPPSIAAPPPAPAAGVNPHGGVNASMPPGPGRPAAASAGSAGQ
jgi:hypothetical protein